MTAYYNEIDPQAAQWLRNLIDADALPAPAGPTNGYWRVADWLLCRDEKWRPVRPGSFPLVDGAPSRVVRLRAYGNAINAQQAKTFIEVGMECLP